MLNLISLAGIGIKHFFYVKILGCPSSESFAINTVHLNVLIACMEFVKSFTSPLMLNDADVAAPQFAQSGANLCLFVVTI